MDILPFLRTIPDYPKPGVLFYDITPLLACGEAFAATLEALNEGSRIWQATKIVCGEARGFLFAAPLAYMQRIGVVPVRKQGKLPGQVYSTQYTLEYGRNTLEMHKEGLTPEDRVLIVDDVLATGGTAGAMRTLVEQSGATVVGCAMLLELVGLKGRDVLDGIPVFSLLSL